MDWKLGMAMSSSGCRSLNTPHVTLHLKVTESRGAVQYHNIEMSLPEFHVRTYNACLSSMCPFIHFLMSILQSIYPFFLTIEFC